jgi:hypothetical protein
VSHCVGVYVVKDMAFSFINKANLKSKLMIMDNQLESEGLLGTVKPKLWIRFGWIRLIDNQSHSQRAWLKQ